jgi:hypothetical protein
MKKLFLIFATIFLFIGCNNINRVKNETFPGKNSITIGSAIESSSSFESVEWSEFTSNQKAKVVVAKCKYKKSLINESSLYYTDRLKKFNPDELKDPINIKLYCLYSSINSAYLMIQFPIPVNKDEKVKFGYMENTFKINKMFNHEELDEPISIVEFIWDDVIKIDEKITITGSDDETFTYDIKIPVPSYFINRLGNNQKLIITPSSLNDYIYYLDLL